MAVLYCTVLRHSNICSLAKSPDEVCDKYEREREREIQAEAYLLVMNLACHIIMQTPVINNYIIIVFALAFPCYDVNAYSKMCFTFLSVFANSSRFPTDII